MFVDYETILFIDEIISYDTKVLKENKVFKINDLR